MSTTIAHHGIEPRKLVALKALYVYTILGAGAAGVWSMFAPIGFSSAFGATNVDPFIVGMSGAVDTGFAICAALGMRAPEQFAPVFLLQLVYKTLWLVVVFAPRAVNGDAPDYAWVLAVVFLSYVIFDLFALPFAQLTARRPA